MPHHDLTLEELSQYFHLPISDVARKLGMCATVLKKQCRRLGIPRWPHRKMRSFDKQIQQLETTVPRDSEDEERIRLEIEHIQRQREDLLRNPARHMGSKRRSSFASRSSKSEPEATEQKPQVMVASLPAMPTMPTIPTMPAMPAMPATIPAMPALSAIPASSPEAPASPGAIATTSPDGVPLLPPSHIPVVMAGGEVVTLPQQLQQFQRQQQIAQQQLQQLYIAQQQHYLQRLATVSSERYPYQLSINKEAARLEYAFHHKNNSARRFH